MSKTRLGLLESQNNNETISTVPEALKEKKEELFLNVEPTPAVAQQQKNHTLSKTTLLLRANKNRSIGNLEINRMLAQQASTMLATKCVMPRVVAALTAEDIHFLETHSTRDLLALPKNEDKFSLKSIIIEILVKTATQLAIETLKEGVKSILTESSEASSSKSQNRSPASSAITEEKSNPVDSAYIITKKIAKKQVKKIAINELKNVLETELKTHPPIGLPQDEADKFAKSVGKTFTTALLAYDTIEKISKNPTKDGIMNTALDLAKSQLVKYSTELLKKGLLKAGTLGPRLAANLNPIVIIAESIFDSYEIDPKRTADKPWLNNSDRLPPAYLLELDPKLREYNPSTQTSANTNSRCIIC